MGAVGVVSDGHPVGGNAVHGRGGGEHEMAHLRGHAALEQRARRAGVVGVVLERLVHRFGHDGEGGEVHDGVDLVALEQLRDRVAVADLADDQRGAQGGLAKAARQVIQDHHPLAARGELQRDV